MSLIEWTVLAIIQGVTEFLPISSSAHLILPSQLFGWTDQGLAFDVAVHVGSLLAVVLYFHKKISLLIKHWALSIARREHEKTLAMQAWYVAIGTVPAVIAGLLLASYVENNLRSILVIAFTTTFFGLLLWLADAKSTQLRTLDSLRLKDAIYIGIAQAMALVPGTSRSGITMTLGLSLGFKRVDCAHFSFLLSIPIILAAGSLQTVELVQSPESFDLYALLFGTVLSFISAFACIALFLKWIERSSLMPFVVYRLVLGAVLFFVYFS